MTGNPWRSLRKSAALGIVMTMLASMLVMFVAPLRAEAAVIRSFSRRFNTRTNGDIVMVANTVQKCPTTVTCVATTNNNGVTTAYVDVDADPTTFNSSSSTFSLPPGGSVLFAGLYWGGDPSTGTGGNAAPTPADKRKIKLQVPGSTSYQTVVATTYDQESATSEYQSFADITSLIPASASGTYTLANLQVGRGTDREGGWAIIFAIADPSQPARDLSVFDGFASVTTSDPAPIPVNVTGLLTPPAGPVKTKVGAIAYEGDAGTNGDLIKLNGITLSNGLNPSNNFFNSSVTNLGVQLPNTPNQTNKLGFDADIVSANGILPNNATSATVTFETGGDFYYPGAMTFVTDLYAPKLDGAKTGVDVNDGFLEPGDLIEYTIVVSNNGQDPSLQTVLTDPIPTGTSFEPGTLSVTAGANVGVKTDATGDDQANFAPGSNSVVFRLGTGADGSSGGRLDVNESTTMKFRVRVDANIANSTTITNQASLSYIGQSIGGSTILAAASTAVATTVVLKADLSLTKTHTGNAVPGTNLVYDFVASNAGPHPSDSPLTVKDTLPTGFTYVAGSATNGFTCSGAAPLTCTKPVSLGTSGASASTAFSITVAVDPSLASGSVTNSATVLSPTTDPVPGNDTATDPTTIARRSELAITKTDGITAATPGQALTYTVRVTNNGPSPITNATVTDSVPAALTNVTWTCSTTGGTCGAASGSGNAINTTASLPNGAVATYVVSGTLNPTTPAGTGTLINTARVAVPLGTTDPTPANNEATDTDDVTPKVDLKITKTDAKTTAIPGTPISYTINVTNAGPSTATNASVIDTMPTGIVNPTWTCAANGTGASCATATGIGNINTTATLPANTSATYVVRGQIDPTLSAGDLVNTASVSTTAATETDPTNNEATDTDTVVPTANLTVTKTDNLADAVPGETLTYTIVVGNDGPSTATDAAIADSVPAAILDPTWTCFTTGAGASCGAMTGSGASINTTATLPANTTATITVTGTLDPATPAGVATLANTATVTIPVGVTDPTPGPTTATDTDNVTPKVDLKISKTNGIATAVPGTPVTYTITVANAGPSTATNAAIVDVVPTAILNPTWTCAATGSGASCATVSGTGNVNTTATLPMSTTATVTVTGTLDPSTTLSSLSNTATVNPASGTTDTETSNNEATDTDVVTPSVDLAVVKTAGNATVIPGSNITYTITVSNSGPSTATAARITDAVPSPLTNVVWTCAASAAPAGSSCSAASGSAAANTIDLPVTIAPGGSVTLTVVATVPANTPASTVTNNVTITPAVGTNDTSTGNNNASVNTNVQASVDLQVTKTNNVSSLTAGSPTTYTIVVTNAGPSTVTNATISDSLPSALTNASWTCVAAGPGASCGAPSGVGSISSTATLGVGATATYLVNATVSATATGSIANTASASTPSGILDPTPGNNSATDTDQVLASGNLSIVKTLTSAVVPGQNVTYSIVASNAGPSAVVGATVSDTLPTSLTNATWTCLPTNAICPSSGSGNISAGVDIGAGGSVAFTLTARLDPGATGPLANTATITPPGGFTDSTAGDNSSTATNNTTPAGDLSITKTNNVSTLLPGSPTTYVIVVSNAGPSVVTNATLADAVPDSIINTTWTCAVSTGTGSCTTASGSGNAVSQLISLGSASSITLTVSGTLSPTAPAGSITNTATVSVPSGFTDANSGNNSATDVDTAVPTGDLSITKTDNITTATPGATNTWTIVVANNGPSTVTSATLSDVTPAGLLNPTWTCQAQTGASTCAVTSGTGNLSTTVTIPAGASIVATMSGTIDPALHGTATQIENTATIATPAGFSDANPGNNSATDKNTLTPTSDLKITKTNGVTTVTPGLVTSYTITVQNVGPSTALGAQVTDILPASLSNATWTCATVDPGADCLNPSGTGNINATVKLPANATATFTLDATMDPALAFGPNALTNTATVKAVDTVDPDTTNDSATDVDSAAPNTGISVSKSNGASSVTAGLPTSYTIVVSNAGPSQATNMRVLDAIPAWLVNGAWSCAAVGGASCATGSGVGGVDTLVTVPVGASITFTQQGVVSAAATANGTLSNTVSLTPPAGTTNITGTLSATDNDTVNAIADVAVTKDRSGQFVAGTTVTYTVVATNYGPSDAPATILTDAMPAGISSMTWVCSGTCGATSGSGSINETIDLAVNTSARYTITALLSPTATTATNNATVTVSPAITDPVSANNNANTTDVVGAVTDLRVSKSRLGPLVAGEATTYTIVVANDGPSFANGVAISDPFAAGVSGMDWTCVAGSGSTCGSTAGSGPLAETARIASGSSVTYTVVVMIDPSAIAPVGQRVNVSATPASNDPNLDNNTYTDTANVLRRVDVRVEKSNGTNTVVAGVATTYRIDVTNSGPSTALNTRVVDAFPTELENVSWSCSFCGVANSLGSLSQLVTLRPGETAQFIVEGTVRQDVVPGVGVLTNTATAIVDPLITESDLTNNVATDVDDVSGKTDLRVEKTSSPTIFIAGRTATYEVIVANNGPSMARGVQVLDTIPSEFTNVAWTCSSTAGATCAGAGVGDIADTVSIPASGRLVYVITALLKADTPYTTLRNEARVKPDPSPFVADQDAGDDEAGVNNDTDRIANIATTKAHSPAVPDAGRAVTYVITVSNSGPSTASVRTIDNVPAALTNVTWTCSAGSGDSCGSSTGSGNVLNDVAQFGAVGSVTYTITGTVSPAFIGTLTNTVSAAPIDATDPDGASANDLATVRVAGDLRITKTNNQSATTPGEVTTYTVVVANDGPANAVGAVVVDTLPSALVWSGANPTWTCAGVGCGAAAGSGALNTTANIAAGASVTYTVTGTVNPGAIGSMTNSVTVTPAGGFIDTNDTNNEAVDTDTLTPTADLRVSKTNGSTQSVPGLATSYTIVVSNVGPSSAPGVRVLDAPPAVLLNPSWTCAGAACAAAAGTGSINQVVSLAPAGSLTFTISGTVDPSAVGSLTNTASLVVPSGITDPDATNNSATDTDTLSPQVAVGVTKTNNLSSVRAGLPTTYTIVVSNTGPSNAGNVTVTDTLPTALNWTGANASWTCATTNGATCAGAGSGSISDVVNLPAGATVTYTLTATVSPDATGTVANTAGVAVSSAVTDATTADDTASDTDPIDVLTDLAIAKTDSALTAVPGTPITYTVTVTNAGPATAVGARVVDTLPAAFQNAWWTCLATPGSSCGVATGTGSINDRVTVAVGGTITYVLRADIDSAASGSLVNTASVTAASGTTDPDTGNNDATDSNTLVPTANLAVTKSNGATSVVPGTQTSYSIVFANNGPSFAPQVNVADAIPASLLNATWTCVASGGAVCAQTSGTGSFSFPNDLPAGSLLSFTVTATVDPTLAATASLENTATATFTTGGITDPDTTNNSATDTDAVTPIADVRITKTNNTGTVVAGSPVRYRIVVKNAGPSAVASVRVQDALPTSLLNATWTCTAVGATCGAASGTNSIDELVSLSSTGEITFVVTADLSPTATGTLTNRATITPVSTYTDPDDASDEAVDADPISTVVELSVTKTDGRAQVIPGAANTYTVVVRNDGPSTAVNARVQDTFPGAFTNASWTCVATAGSTCAPTSGGPTSAIDELVTLAPNATVTYIVTGTVNAASVGALTNTATVTKPASAVELDTTDNSATDVDTLTPTLDLAITKTNGVGAVVPGSPVSWTINVTGTGSSWAPRTRVVDAVPASVRNVTWTCVSVDGRSTCHAATGSGSLDELVDIAPNGQVRFVVSGFVDEAAIGRINNTAAVSASIDVRDPDLGNNSDSDDDPLTPVADLVVTKSNNVASVVPGTPVAYVITVTNDGPSTSVRARITDTLPAALRNATWSCVSTPAGLCPSGAGVGSIAEIATLAAGVQLRYTVQADIDPAARGTLSNTASAANGPGTTDPDAVNSSATDADPLVATSAISVVKTDGRSSSLPGTDIVYAIRVANAGPSEATNSLISDVFPALLLNPTWSCEGSGVTCPSPASVGSPAALSETVTLPVGASIDYTIRGRIDPAAVGTFANTATVTPGPGIVDSTPLDNSSTDTNVLAPTADLQINKSNGAIAVVPGTPTSYTIDVINEGPSVAPGSRVRDTLPAWMVNGTWTCEIVYGTGTCPGGGLTGSGAGDLDVPIDLGVFAHAVFRVTGDVLPGATGRLVNTASVTPGIGINDPVLADNESTDDDELLPSAGLSITKTDNATSQIPGTGVTYLIVVSNAGPSQAPAAHVIDTLPASLLNASWTCASAAGAVCTNTNGAGSLDEVVSIPVGGSLTYTVNATIDPSALGVLENAASVDPGVGVDNPETARARSTDTSLLIPNVDLKVTKDDSKTSSPAGTRNRYEIVVTNSGVSTATDARVVDTLGADLVDGTWTCVASVGSRCVASGVGSLDQLVTIPAGGEVRFVMEATVRPGFVGVVTNVATVAAASGSIDTDLSNNQASDVNDAPLVVPVGVSGSDPSTPTTTAPTATGSSVGPSTTDTAANPTALGPSSTAPVPAPATESNQASSQVPKTSATSSTRTLSGTVFFDQNVNGKRDGGEVAIPNATVTLVDRNGKRTVVTTDADGRFYVGELAQGTYDVEVVSDRGNVVTTTRVVVVAGADLQQGIGVTTAQALAFTGASQILRLLVIGAVCMLGGMGVIVATPRRRRRRTL
jgi:uncharacterized repeat protein (TIGR01451 family)